MKRISKLHLSQTNIKCIKLCNNIHAQCRINGMVMKHGYNGILSTFAKRKTSWLTIVFLTNTNNYYGSSLFFNTTFEVYSLLEIESCVVMFIHKRIYFITCDVSAKMLNFPLWYYCGAEPIFLNTEMGQFLEGISFPFANIMMKSQHIVSNEFLLIPVFCIKRQKHFYPRPVFLSKACL